MITKFAYAGEAVTYFPTRVTMNTGAASTTYAAQCPACDATLLGKGTLTHNDDGSHGWIPAAIETEIVIEDDEPPESPKNDPVPEPDEKKDDG